MTTMENKVNQLAQILKRLNQGDEPAAVRAQAQDLVSQLSAAELSLAEQQLVDEGLPEEHLRGLCSVHMEMLESELNRFKNQLPQEHVLYTMIEEHDQILGLLEQLEQVNRRIQGSADFADADLSQLVSLAEQLIGAEPHHEREEKVLFTEMERREVSGPPRIMRMEHNDLRAMKKLVRELGKSAQRRDLTFMAFQEQLEGVAAKLVFTLQDHIFKENNILYPTALEVIEGDNVWEQVKERCDAIGYCSFTPVHQKESA